ncbi:MAG TPA: DNA replication/repair protein RecF [Acetivibrio sp.]|nr:DNA replication/repair protein RecF [Acetivibrio sp.]
MYIKSLSLKDFRNYKNAFILFSKNLNIIYGNNAQGKTNIIEAIFLCASGRSHRTSKDIEMVSINKNEFNVSVELIKEEENKSIEMKYETGKKKMIRINEIPVVRIGNLMGNLIAVIFSPEDIMIVKEGPALRRRFIDISISQLKPSYFYDLQQYNKILLQRNTLLKEIQFNRSLIETLEIWDEKISETAARIMKVRNSFLFELNQKAKDIHYKITNGCEELDIKYNPSIDKTDLSDAENIKNKLMAEFSKMRNAELKRCITMVGPHRDDYDILLNGLNLKIYGSQGQQRTAVLSLKLAEIEIIKNIIGENPVLLLDDVMSELDLERREFLLENIKNIQTFITCTEKDVFMNKKLDEALFIHVEDGNVKIEN